MSWLWSAPPPDNEADAQPSSSDFQFSDPYSTRSVDQAPTDAFGTAFDDDADATNADSSSFDVYASSSPSVPAFDGSALPPLPNDPFAPLAADGSPPAVDFSSMTRINPAVLSSRSMQHGSPAADYVFSDDYSEVRKKASTEQLTFFTGSAYLLGMAVGAGTGLASALPASRGKASRLRLNAVLNAVAKRGSNLGNAGAVLALTFSLSEAAIYNYTSDDTLFNYAAAGGMAGALFKSTRGIRLAGIWGVGGACFALASVYASRQGYYGRGLQGVL